MDFGKNKEGISLYRINGSKDEINQAIDQFKDLGCEVWDEIELEKSHKSWSVLLRLMLPNEEEELEEPKKERSEK
jgi:hypothetical protein